MVSVSGGKFSLGQMVMTQGVASECETDQKFNDFVLTSIGRHTRGDWGNLSQGDKAENNYSLGKHLRLLSAYEMEGLPKIWIITEADRSVTTVLFPDEY